jgi:hypothetical protein
MQIGAVHAAHVDPDAQLPGSDGSASPGRGDRPIALALNHQARNDYLLSIAQPATITTKLISR